MPSQLCQVFHFLAFASRLFELNAQLTDANCTLLWNCLEPDFFSFFFKKNGGESGLDTNEQKQMKIV